MNASMAAKVAIMSAALSAWQPAQAQKAPDTTHDVAVALVDVGANGLYSKDPNVRFVDMTPPLKQGDHHAFKRVAGNDHGDIVAQSFIDEYRRLDPEARITFYTVNPFVERGVTGGTTVFSRSMIQQALPAMKEAGVRIAVTTFGVADEAAGARIVKDFQDNGMIVFAATPNNRDDAGIWPAASKTTISVADGVTGESGFLKTRSWAKWVDFVANGNYHSGSIDTDGSSFATPRVAAYGAYIEKRRPGIDVDGLRTALKEGARQVTIHDRQFPRLDGEDVARRVVAIEAARPPEVKVAAAAPVEVARPETVRAPVRPAVLAAMAAGMTR